MENDQVLYAIRTDRKLVFREFTYVGRQETAEIRPKSAINFGTPDKIYRSGTSFARASEKTPRAAKFSFN